MTKIAVRKAAAKKSTGKKAARKTGSKKPVPARARAMLDDLRGEAQALSERVGRLLQRFS
jgi:hypothetical protein